MFNLTCAKSRSILTSSFRIRSTTLSRSIEVNLLFLCTSLVAVTNGHIPCRSVNRKKAKRASTWENVPSHICVQWTLKPAYASSQTDQSMLSARRIMASLTILYAPGEDSDQTARMRRLSESLQGAYIKAYVFWRCGWSKEETYFAYIKCFYTFYYFDRFNFFFTLLKDHSNALAYVTRCLIVYVKNL